jgi:hypothetical protein
LGWRGGKECVPMAVLGIKTPCLLIGGEHSGSHPSVPGAFCEARHAP